MRKVNPLTNEKGYMSCFLSFGKLYVKSRTSHGYLIVYQMFICYNVGGK